MPHEINPESDTIHMELSRVEILNAIRKTHTGKAPGIDCIPYEILKSGKLTDELVMLYQKCFKYGLIPNDWNMIIIKPIPKKGKDPRIPLNTRGLNLMSSIAKVYTSVLNERIKTYLETNKKLCEEQCAYRKDRSCTDNLFILTSLIRSRKSAGLPTYACFVDYSRAFDVINVDLLMYRIHNIGINGGFYKALRSLYTDMYACVEVGKYRTDIFRLESGIRQGDVLAPTMFTTYVDSLLERLKKSGIGIQVQGEVINALMYADDLCMIASSEAELQKLIDIMSEWCREWRLCPNITKTCIIHFRPASHNRTTFCFNLNGEQLTIVPQTRYLGLDLNETLDFTVIANTLAKAASRALGALIAKTVHNRGFDFAMFEKLYKTTVEPIMEYSASIWGYKQYTKLDTVMHRALKFFLKVGKTCPTPMILGDTGWLPTRINRKIHMVKWWNRLISQSHDRLTRRVFEYDMNLRGHGAWCKDVKRILCECSLECHYTLNEPEGYVDIQVLREKLKEKHVTQWHREASTMNKLELYRSIKQEYGLEGYVQMKYITTKQRSVIAAIRGGILPIEVEKGRWRGIPRHERICKQCTHGCVEDTQHFLLECPHNQQERSLLMAQIQGLCSNVTVENLLANTRIYKYVAIYIIDSLTKPRK